MPGVRALSWPWMFSLWELHRVVGMRTWEEEQKREAITEAERPESSGHILCWGEGGPV